MLKADHYWNFKEARAVKFDGTNALEITEMLSLPNTVHIYDPLKGDFLILGFENVINVLNDFWVILTKDGKVVVQEEEPPSASWQWIYSRNKPDFTVIGGPENIVRRRQREYPGAVVYKRVVISVNSEREEIFYGEWSKADQEPEQLPVIDSILYDGRNLDACLEFGKGSVADWDSSMNIKPWRIYLKDEGIVEPGVWMVKFSDGTVISQKEKPSIAIA